MGENMIQGFALEGAEAMQAGRLSGATRRGYNLRTRPRNSMTAREVCASYQQFAASLWIGATSPSSRLTAAGRLVGHGGAARGQENMGDIAVLL
jgi:hypothetical protein